MDIWLHPVRFADDVLFGFGASDPDVADRLSRFAIPDDVFRAQANLLKIQNYRGFAPFDRTLIDGAALFVGQMARDKSVLAPTGFLGLADFEAEFAALARDHPHVYFARHPNEPRLDPRTADLLARHRNVSEIDAPSYHLLADRRIATVAAISSSMLEEARHFGKAVRCFHRPPFPVGDYAAVMQAFCFPHFWADVLGGVADVAPASPAAFPDPKNKLRHALSFYWGYRTIDRYEHALAAPLSPAAGEGPAPAGLTVETAEVVSFDVFDTLLARRVALPSDVFAAMAVDAARLAGCDPSAFADRRIAAEAAATKAARRHGRDDPTHAEVYAALLGSTPDDPRVADLIGIEIAAELDVLRARPAVQALYAAAQKAGRRIVVVSDTCLAPDTVATMLRSAGYDGWSALYVSSDRGRTKREGSLWDLVLAGEGCPPDRILHVGDNPTGDVERAQSRGIATLHLPRALETMRRAAPYLGTAVARIVAAGPENGSRIAAEIATRRYDDPDDPAARSPAFGHDARLFGYVALGPVLAGFAAWLHDRATVTGTRRLAFLTREGPVLRAAYETLHPDSPIATATVFASRRIAAATRLATDEGIAEAVARSTGGTYRSVADLFAVRFGLAAADLDPDALAAAGFPGPGTAVDHRTPPDAIRQAVDAHAAIIRRRSSEARDRLAAYLSDAGLDDAGSAVVDIGYAGRVQAAFADVLGRPLSGFYLGTFRTARAVLGDLPAEGYLFQDADPADRRHGLCRHRRIWETLLCAPGPSWRGVEHGPDGWRGVPAEGGETPVRDRFVRDAHEGALDFVRDYAERRDTARPSPLVATAILDALLDRPTDELRAWLGALEFDDAYDGPGVRPLAGAGSVWSAGPTGRRAPGRGPGWAAAGPYGVLGWRHALTPFVAAAIARIGDANDVAHYRDDPISFFRRLTDPRYRRIGRLLYPRD